MKGILKSDLAVSICIGLSYLLLWAVAEFLAVSFNFSNFLSAYAYILWQNLYVLFINLLIFHLLRNFVSTRTKKAGWVILSIVLVLLLMSFGFFFWENLGNSFINTLSKTETRELSIGHIFPNMLYQLLGILYFTFFKLAIGNLTLKSKNQQLQIEKKNSELSFLKSQTNPHFLFNTLNNIYSLARDKSDLTADSVLRLSDILRYMLYGTQSNLVTVDKEVNIIEEYIELEKMRYYNSLKISFRKNIDNPELEIPPLLLIPLVENAFKHGASETISSPFIEIDLVIKSNTLQLHINNSSEADDNFKEPKENIGLNNLRRQLALLFSEYRLDVKNNGNSFTVKMFVNLNSYAKN
jgi:two-component system, LytTR family, sensor kinase